MKIQFKSSEVFILLAAAGMSFVANLPDQMLGNLLDRKILLASLTALVVVAMFRYLQVVMLLTISILVIGANLPADLADALGISQLALLISLGVLIAVTLLNRVYKMLPTEREVPANKLDKARQALMKAIVKGKVAEVQELLESGLEVNFTQDGTSPLHLAAAHGYPEIVRLLISHGAVFFTKNAEGQTPLDIALTKKKFVQTTEILFNASQTSYATSAKGVSRRGEADMWRHQNGF